MKIVHIIVGLQTGGAETMLVRLIHGMPQHTHVVIALTTVGPLGEDLRGVGHSVHALGLNPWTAWRALPGLWRLIRQLRPDVVQTWMYHADLLGGVIGRLAGVRGVVWNVRNTEIPQGRLSATGLVIRLCAALSSWLPRAIVCCAHAGVASHAALGYRRSRMLVIPNGYDTGQWLPTDSSRDEARSACALPREAFVVGIVGRFDPLKGYDVFVAAAARISQLASNAVFVMVGRQVDEGNQELCRLIACMGGGATFRMLGERRDVARLMSAMDVYCLSSKAEGFPNVVAEAMLMQVPCVVTDVGDAARIVGAAGKVVPPGDPAALADAVVAYERIGKDGRRAVGRAARQRVVDHYGIEAVSRQYEQLYEKVREGTGAP